jgi:hypothetical protein
MAFCVVTKEATLRYLFFVSSGCLRTEAIAWPINARFDPVKGSFPESQIVAVLLGSWKPSDPTLRPCRTYC